MKNVLIISFLLVLVGAGCLNRGDDSSGYSIWKLRGNDLASLSEEVPVWANEHFTEGANGEVVGTIPEESRVTGMFTLVEAFDVEVIDIPNNRRVKPYKTPQEPALFMSFVLKDAAGKLFVAHVKSMDGESFRGITMGPALDHQVATHFSNDPLTMWPAPEIRNPAEAAGAKLVMIPYPVPVHQVYYQYGDDVQTAKLVHVESGASYDGLNALLDSIEADWASMR